MREQSTPITDPIFQEMLRLATEHFHNCAPTDSAFHQCIVLHTADNVYKTYAVNGDNVADLAQHSCAILTSENNALIRDIVCMWGNGAVDVPAYAFLKKLCALNAENKLARVWLRSSPDTHTAKCVANLIG